MDAILGFQRAGVEFLIVAMAILWRMGRQEHER
jgi:hypothetical protein